MNNVSDHEATMPFLYRYVVRKNISPPGSSDSNNRGCHSFFKFTITFSKTNKQTNKQINKQTKNKTKTKQNKTKQNKKKKG